MGRRPNQRPPRPAPGQVAPQVPSDETLAKERAVLVLRTGGASFDQISREVGYADRGSAHAAFRRAMRRTLVAPAAELRELEQHRLDMLHMAVWPKALAGDYKAIDRVLKIAERRARLIGLDHADGLAERSVALSERSGELLIAGMQAFLRQMGLDSDERARSAAAEMFRQLHVSLELEAGDGDVVDAELVPDPPAAAKKAAARPAKKAAKRAPPRPRKATATRLDKEPT